MSLRKRLSRVKEICRLDFIHFRQVEKSALHGVNLGYTPDLIQYFSTISLKYNKKLFDNICVFRVYPKYIMYKFAIFQFQ